MALCLRVYKWERSMLGVFKEQIWFVNFNSFNLTDTLNTSWELPCYTWCTDTREIDFLWKSNAFWENVCVVYLVNIHKTEKWYFENISYTRMCIIGLDLLNIILDLLLILFFQFIKNPWLLSLVIWQNQMVHYMNLYLQMCSSGLFVKNLFKYKI